MAEPRVLPPLHAVVVREALDAGVNPALALALAHRESGFNPTNVSPTGVTGLLQVTNDTGGQYGQTPQARTDPQVSARAGLRYFRDLLDKNNGDVVGALGNYNGGSDPNFASHVLSLYPQYAHLASLQREQPQEQSQDAQTLMVADASARSAPRGQGGGFPARPDLDALDAQMRPAAQPAPLAPPTPTTTPPATPTTGGFPARPDLDALDAQMRPARQPAPESGSGALSSTPSDITIDIEKSSSGTPLPSTSTEGAGPSTLQGGPVRGPSLPGTAPSGVPGVVGRAGDPIPLRPGGTALDYLQPPGESTQPLGTALLRELGVPATQIAGTMAGARLGAGIGTMVSPGVGTAVGGVVGGIAGGLGANRLVDLAGITPKEAPLIRVGPVSITPSDVAAIVAPILPELPGAARWVGGKFIAPAKQAITEAANATELARAAWQKEAQAALDAQAKGQTNLYNAAVKNERELYRDYASLQREYDAAVTKAQQFDVATQAQTAAVPEVQALPGRYQPQMPPRTMSDVRLDLRRLDQEGEAAQAVIKRLGVASPEEAASALTEEMLTRSAAGEGRGVNPQPPAPVVARQAAPPEVPSRPELQAFIRNEHGGIKLEGQKELVNDFAGLIRNRETGTSGLFNNVSGKTPQQIAEAAAEAGYIKTADKGALLDALRESQGGRPVYPMDMEPVLPPQPAITAAPQVSAGVGGKVSRQLYQRFDDIAGGAPVDLSPMHETLGTLGEQLKDASPEFQKLTKQLTALTTESTGSDVHALMKKVGPYTRGGDGTTRGAANQVFSSLQDALETSLPEHRQFLTDAKVAWKQEQGVNELERALRSPTGRGGVLKQDAQNRTVVNVQGLMNLANNQKVMRWFPPEQQAAFKQDIAQFAGTPAMPKGPRPSIPPQPVAPESLPGGAPWAVSAPATIPPQPGAVEPALGPRPSFLGGVSLRDIIATGTAFTHSPTIGKVVGGMAFAKDIAFPQLQYMASQIMLSPSLRPMLLRQLQGTGGVLTPEIKSWIAGFARSTGEAEIRQEQEQQRLHPPRSVR